MKLLLIRHGESAGNAEKRMQGQFDSPLTQCGREEVRALAERLRGEVVSAIYASDLCRAAETARILAEDLGAPVLLDARLREYDIGAFTGLLAGEVEALYPEIWQSMQPGRERLPIPGEEGLDAFHARIASVSGEILSQPDGTLAVVAHGGSLGMLLVHLLGIAVRRPLPFVFDNASLTVVEVGRRGPRVTLANCTCHLK